MLSQNQGWVYQERVKSADAGQTILSYYTSKYRHSNEQEWQTRIESGQVLLNSTTTNTMSIVQPQDELTYHRSPWVEPTVPIQFETLYADQDLLVINKPSGLPVLPGGNFLEHTLLWQLKRHYPQNPPVPIHRLGRGTSGLMLLGRSQLAKSHLAQQMRTSTNADGREHQHKHNQLSKIYRALVPGNSIGARLIINQPIGKISHPVLGYIHGATPLGKPAHSKCCVIERYADSTLVEIKISTGRPHQIRIHLASVGYPLLGDPLYVAGGIFDPIATEQIRQSVPVPGDCGYFLHAYSLSFFHPQTCQRMSFKCPIPWQ